MDLGGVYGEERDHVLAPSPACSRSLTFLDIFVASGRASESCCARFVLLSDSGSEIVSSSVPIPSSDPKPVLECFDSLALILSLL